MNEFDALRDFAFQQESTNTLQQQLYQAIKNKILEGKLKPGTRLPSSRTLSSTLQASRNTITGALEHLKAEGYVSTQRGSGHFVSTALPDHYLQTASAKPKRFSPKFSSLPLSSVGKRLHGTGKPRNYRNTSFEVGMPDLKAFPVKKWGQIYHRQSQRLNLLGYDELQGYPYLREVLADYLKSSRGVDCAPEQIIVTNGAQQAASIIIQVLLNPGDEVYLENPGYIGMREAFIANHCRVKGINVGKNGIDISSLPSKPQGKLLCVTPTHQYPLGGIMPLTNRLKVLQWAADNGIWLLEDDYDSEYHYDHKPIAAMQGLGLQDQVIYIGSFSKVLYPSLRLGYMVVPKQLTTTCAKAKHFMAGQTPIIEQATVAEFIAEGHFVRHLRRMRENYGQKFCTIIAACEKHLDELAKPEYTGAGMHIVLIFESNLQEKGLLDTEIVKAMADKKIYSSPLSAYYIGKPEHHGLVLGFANTELDKIDSHIYAIKNIIGDLLKRR